MGAERFRLGNRSDVLIVVVVAAAVAWSTANDIEWIGSSVDRWLWSFVVDWTLIASSYGGGISAQKNIHINELLIRFIIRMKKIGIISLCDQTDLSQIHLPIVWKTLCS